MKINLDRLCRLAGLESGAKSLNEASNRSMHEDPALAGEADHRFGQGQLAEKSDHYHEGDGDADDERGNDAEVSEGGHYGHPVDEEEQEEGMMHMHEEEQEEGSYMEDMDMDEMIEVDEAMLVQEIRRARKMIAESARKQATPEQLAEQKLKKIVAEEVENVMKDLNLTSGWVYGDRKPRNSKRGVVNTAFPGIGFKNSK